MLDVALSTLHKAAKQLFINCLVMHVVHILVIYALDY